MRLFFGVNLGLIVGFILILIFVPGTWGDRPHPADDELLTNFRAHQAEFEQLRKMCQEDAQMVRIADHFLWKEDTVRWPRPEPEWGISRERWDAYKDLFIKVKLDNGLVSYQPKGIHFFANNRGMVTGGSSKGYAYLAQSPNQLFDSIDYFSDHSLSSADVAGATAFRRIEGDWYLFIEKD